MSVRLVGERLDLGEEVRTGWRGLCKMAGERGSSPSGLRTGDRVRLRTLQHRRGDLDQPGALFCREELVTNVDGRLLVHATEAGVV
eukprot:scaffold287968_cov33-Tisochrysis_lutea.AAC.1